MATRISKTKKKLSTNASDPRKKPVQERSRFTVDQILEAAAQVFDKHGYSDGTTNRIARQAGVSIGTLYQYFSGKESILVALLECHIQESIRKLHEWAGHILSRKHGLEAALREYVIDILNIHTRQPRLQHILLEQTPLPKSVHQLLLKAEMESAKTMAGLLDTFPEITRETNEINGYFVVQTVESLAHRYAAHPYENMMDEVTFTDELVLMLVSYLLHKGATLRKEALEREQ